MSLSQEKVLIEFKNITKIFSSVLANDNISLQIKSGEIHALLGENGAGKSTLMSILFGLYTADSGTIVINGQRAQIQGPNDAIALGIGMVHQHFKLVHNYTITENIILGMEPVNRLGNLDTKSSEDKIKILSDKYNLRINPKDKIENISVGMQQRVEILKLLYRDAHILIFDEPTAVLTPQEIEELSVIFAILKSEGKTIILITHKLREITQNADRCTVLRKGKVIDTVIVKNTSEESLAEKMVGRNVQFATEKRPSAPGELILDIQDLYVRNSQGFDAVKNVSLQVRAGEILGIAGVDCNGQSELIEAVCGMRKIAKGCIYLRGKNISNYTIRQRIEAGIGYVPEDRHKHGLILGFRLEENMVLKSFVRSVYSGFLGLLKFSAIQSNAANLISQFDIRASEGPSTKTSTMSGGNQQKALIARELDLSPSLLVIAQPTRGLDVGAIEYIHKRIIAERDKGRAVLLVSFELDEILNLCDRIATISGGRIIGTVDAMGADPTIIGAMMAGKQ